MGEKLPLLLVKFKDLYLHRNKLINEVTLDEILHFIESNKLIIIENQLEHGYYFTERGCGDKERLLFYVKYQNYKLNPPTDK